MAVRDPPGLWQGRRPKVKDAMRFLGFFLVLLGSVSAAAAADGWKEYSNAQWGFAALFPRPPTVTDQPYPSANGMGVIEHVYSSEAGGVTYLVSVADFSKTRAPADKTTDEAVARLVAKGRLTIDYPSHMGIEFGREIGVVDKDGTTYTDAFFFVGRKLYQIEVIYPLKNSDPVGSSGIGYFQTSFRWL
jgi:hypothetical protein